MKKQSDPQVPEKVGFGLRQWIGIIAFIFGLFLSWTLFKIGMSIHQNRKIYNEVANFIPTENSRIEIERWEADGDSYAGITLSGIEAQQATMEVLSRLEYGGFYLYSDSFSPVKEWKGISAFDQGGHYYSIKLFPDREKFVTAWITVGSQQSYDALSQLYKLKYDNWEPVRSYLDQFWEENTPINGAVF